MIECPTCGSNLVYDIARRTMYCKACDNAYSVERVEKEQDGIDSSQMELSVFICPQCAGEIYSTDDAATAFCSYCGAATMLSSRLKNERKPDYVIPFSVTKERCKDAYVKMMKKAIYAPRRLRSKDNIQEFRGIYMPYWLYDVSQTGKTVVKAIESYHTADASITDTYEVSSYANNHYENIAVDASSLFPDDLSSKVAPFNAFGMKPFMTGYLSGFYADLPDVDYEIYKNRIAQITGDLAYENLVQMIHERQGDMEIEEPQVPLSETLHIDITEAKTALFPVWFMSYKNGNRIAYATVNGTTGKVAADIPMDIKKFLFGCLIGMIPVFFLLNLFLTIRPSVLLALVAMIGAFVALVHSDEMKKIADVETHETDEGFFARHTLNDRLEKERKRKEQETELREKYGDEGAEFDLEQPVVVSGTKKKKKKNPHFLSKLSYGVLTTMLVLLVILFVISIFGTFSGDVFGFACYIVAPISCLIAIYGTVKGIINVSKVKKKSGIGGVLTAIGTILATVIIILHPVKDLFYYGGVVLVCVTVILTLIDIILSYDRLSTRPLPQFEYKGGDHRA